MSYSLIISFAINLAKSCWFHLSITTNDWMLFQMLVNCEGVYAFWSFLVCVIIFFNSEYKPLNWFSSLGTFVCSLSTKQTEFLTTVTKSDTSQFEKFIE